MADAMTDDVADATADDVTGAIGDDATDGVDARADDLAGAVTIHHGLPDHLRESAATIFDEAFSEKLKWAIPSRELRLMFLEASLSSAHALAALQGETLVGLAGLSASEGTYRGRLMSGPRDAREMARALGIWGALRAGAVLGVGGHKPSKGELYLDGIAVAGSARGQGIGTKLLDEVARLGQEGGFDWIRLEVIDTNTRAQQLYERRGYRVTKLQDFGFLRRFIGFGGVATMELALSRGDRVAD